MAIVIDAARPAEVTVTCANETYQRGNDVVTPKASWDIGFILKAAYVEESIVDDTPPTLTLTDARTVDFTDFWLASTPGTDRT